MIDALHRYLLPGLVFQGIVIGGGYATGRELVEFFLKHGALEQLEVGRRSGVAAIAVEVIVRLSNRLLLQDHP